MPNGTPPFSSNTSEHKFVEVAIAIVFDQSLTHLLICKRKPDTVLAGYWEFPGGKCNPGESPEACACREVAEETALIVKPIRPLAIIEHNYPHAFVRLHPFLCQHTAGQLQLLAVAEAKWIPPQEITQYRFPEANHQLLQAVSQGYEALTSQF